jgi:hypothetical protein
MPILDLQKRLREVGRIRLGEQRRTEKGKSYPAKLTGFRFTSALPHVLEAVADVHGGDVRPWEGHPGEFELYTQATELDVRVLPGHGVTAWWEQWSGGGLVRQCDGETINRGDGKGSPCKCPAELEERLAAGRANPPAACLPRTRLSCVLPEIPTIGSWVLTSTGVNAAVELPGIAELLEELTRKGAIVPARLRMDQRADVKGGQTRKYVVPVLDLELPMRRLEAIMMADRVDAAELVEPVVAPALPAGHTPIAGGRGTVQAAAALEAAQERREVPQGGKGAAPMGAVSGRQRTTADPADVIEGSSEPDPEAPAPATTPAGRGDEKAPERTPDDAARTSPPPADPEPPAGPPQGPPATGSDAGPAADVGGSAPPSGPLPESEQINDAQKRKLFATARDCGLDRDDVARIVERLYGSPTTKCIPRGELDVVLEAFASELAERSAAS